MTLLETPPKRIFAVLGRGGDPHKRRSGRHFGSVGKGSFNPFDLTAEIPRAKAVRMTVLMIFCLLGKSWKGGEALVPI